MTPNLDHSKQSIRAAVAEGQVGQALQQATAYATYCNLTDILNGLTVLSGKYQHFEQDQLAGLLDQDSNQRTFARISHDLLAYVDRLPDEPVAAKGKKKPLELRIFKNRVFYVLCLTKLAVLAWLLYQQSAGGYTQEQLQSTAAILAPAFAAYLSVMLADYLRQAKGAIETPRYVNGPLITFAYWLFPLYALALWWLLRAKAAGYISFASLTLWLGLVESVLGGYIGQIVQALFRKE